MQHLLTHTDENRILHITINRPDKLNALNMTLLGELHALLEDYEQVDEVCGIIITGSGAKAFAAGADIAEFAHFNANEGCDLSARGHHIFNTIEHYPKPIIAAVNGFALGGGCELAMACHIRVAATNAKFGQPEVNLGIIPGYGGTQRLVQLVGKGKALELLMTADIIGATEALQLGLVNHVVEPEQLMPKCVEILKKISSKAPLAIEKIIQCVNAHFAGNHSGFDAEVKHFGECCDTQDFKEGTTAFLEKRAAKFVGQ
jgi:enoyl-CoA hydratase